MLQRINNVSPHFTVCHFLLECVDFAQVRNNCFHVDNMKQLFQDIHIDSIMTFLRQIIWIIDIRNNLVYFGADLHCLCHNLLFITALN